MNRLVSSLFCVYSKLKCGLKFQYMQMAPQLGVTSYKPDGVNQHQPRVSMISMSGDTVPYGMMPQLATLQIGNSVGISVIFAKKTSLTSLFLEHLTIISIHKSNLPLLSTSSHYTDNANG